MSMSYCQWANAQADFCQCIDTFEEEGQPLVNELVEDYKNGYTSEFRSFTELRKLAQRFLDMCDEHEIPDIDNLKVVDA